MALLKCSQASVEYVRSADRDENLNNTNCLPVEAADSAVVSTAEVALAVAVAVDDVSPAVDVSTLIIVPGPAVATAVELGLTTAPFLARILLRPAIVVVPKNAAAAA